MGTVVTVFGKVDGINGNLYLNSAAKWPVYSMIIVI